MAHGIYINGAVFMNETHGWSGTHVWGQSRQRPGFWFVSDDFTGGHGFATVDDFGNLVRVP